MSARQGVWRFLESTKDGDTVERAFHAAMLALIFLNVVAVVVGSIESVEARWGTVLYGFEVISVAVFTAEYLARLWACTADPRFQGAVHGRVRFALKGMSIIDLLAILPFYLPLVGVDLRSLRSLRLLRMFRIAKVGRYYSSLDRIKDVFHAKREELVLTSAFMLLMLIVSSSVLYYIENPAQPDVFSSIPATMWWAVATLTTVGYGDIYPVTVLGKVFASVIAILGIGMFALPTGIIGAGFVESVQRTKEPSAQCPHCGGELP